MQDSYRDKACAFCEQMFSPARAGQLYCSPTCRSKMWKQRNEERINERRRREVQCKGCGVVFETTDIRKKFCDAACRLKWFNNRRERNKNYKKTCPVCQRNFLEEIKRGGGRKYCSHTCMRKANYDKSRERSESHFEYRKKYKWEGNWWAALQRDKFTCQKCGKQLYPSQWNKRGNRKLVVHHMDGMGERFGKNHALDNLQTLCGLCHSKFHTKVSLVVRDGKYYISGEIFKELGIESVGVFPQGEGT